MSSVLIAEPAAPVAAALRKYLEGDGREIVVVATRDEALRELREHPPTVFVSSLSPALDGEELCREAKKLSPALPVLLLYMPEEEHPEARAATVGADACLVGPIKRTMVLTCVRLLIKLAAAWNSGAAAEEAPVLEPQPDELVFEAAPEPAPAAVAPAAPAPASAPAPIVSAAAAASPDFEFFKRLLLMEVKRSRRYRYPIALLLVELDRFNERTQGLQPMQRTASLVETLKLLTSGVRDIDVAVPVTEGRFVVFLPHTGQDGALVVAERLREKLKVQHPVPDMTASVGLAVFEPGVGRPQDQTQVSFGNLMKDAGEALRKAQAGGGDRVETHQPRPPSGPRDRISMG